VATRRPVACAATFRSVARQRAFWWSGPALHGKYHIGSKPHAVLVAKIIRLWRARLASWASRGRGSRWISHSTRGSPALARVIRTMRSCWTIIAPNKGRVGGTSSPAASRQGLTSAVSSPARDSIEDLVKGLDLSGPWIISSMPFAFEERMGAPSGRDPGGALAASSRSSSQIWKSIRPEEWRSSPRPHRTHAPRSMLCYGNLAHLKARFPAALEIWEHLVRLTRRNLT